MQQLGILCGTFNPIHWGHLLLGECARSQFQLEKVIYATSPSPPHRHDYLLDAESRHKLVIAAVSGNPFFEASRIELDRSGPSYTIDTLEQIKRSANSDVALNLIVGADNVPFIKQWHRAEDIFKICRLLVAPRNPNQTDNRHYVLDTTDSSCTGINIAQIDFPAISISSTIIRQRLQNNQSVLYMVPEAVDKLIAKYRFYSHISKQI